jgi:hypothetical protein
VRRRAGARCEYCLVPEAVTLVAHEVDHVVARKHRGSDDISNLALSCTLCNKCKGTDLTTVDPETGDLTPLFNPRRDRWSDHFRLDGALIVGRTAVGRSTVILLQLNRPERINERRRVLELGLLGPSSGVAE